MKRALAVLITVFALAMLALPLATARADAGSWNGWITDSHCGAKGASAKHTKACAEKCVKEGGKLVFYNSADKKTYQIDKQDEAMNHIGHMVTVTGEATGDSIKVDSIKPAEAKKS
jgi:uncharacterized protein DUF5818